MTVSHANDVNNVAELQRGYVSIQDVSTHGPQLGAN